MTVNTHTAMYYDRTGYTMEIGIKARTLRGAKVQAYRLASGDITEIVLITPEGRMYTRTARDMYWGFCTGANEWAELKQY